MELLWFSLKLNIPSFVFPNNFPGFHNIFFPICGRSLNVEIITEYIIQMCSNWFSTEKVMSSLLVTSLLPQLDSSLITLEQRCPTCGPRAACGPGWLRMQLNTKSSIYLKHYEIFCDTMVQCHVNIYTLASCTHAWLQFYSGVWLPVLSSKCRQ